MTRDQFLSLFFIALLVFIIYEIFLIFSPFRDALFGSGILAFTFYPVYNWIKRFLKTHDLLAALLTTLLIFMLVIPPLVLLIVNVTQETIELYQSASQYVREGRLETLIEKIRTFSLVQNIKSQLLEWEPLKKNAADWLLNSTKTIGNVAASQVGTFTKNIFFIILNILVMTVLTFIFLKDGEKIYRFIYQIAPMEEKNKKNVFREISETFSAVIRGQVLTGIVQATVAGILFWLLGVPLAIFFGILIFICAMIPVLGAASVWLPLSVYLFFITPWKGIALFVLGTCVISVIDNIMKPAIIGEKTKLPYVLLFFGILGGLKLYGLMGVFLAPVVLSLFFALIQIYKEKYV